MTENVSVMEQFIEALFRAFPGPLADDLRQNLRAAVSAVFDRLDLVTREEMAIQEAVLARTRDKVDALEQQLQKLEAGLNKPPPGTEQRT